MSSKAVAALVSGDSEVKSWYGNNQVMGMTNGSYAATNVQGCYVDWYHDYYYPRQPVYNYITHPLFIEDKTKKAFAIAKKCIKSKFMKADKVDEFIELVEMIEKEL